MAEHVAHGFIVGADRNERAVVNRHEQQAAQRRAEPANRRFQPVRYPGGDGKSAYAAKGDVEDDRDEPDAGTEQRRPPYVARPEAGAARETEQRLRADDRNQRRVRYDRSY